MSMGETIRERRQEAGLTLEELQDKTDLTDGYLSKVERDRALPSADAINNIATVLGMADAEVEALLLERLKRAWAEQLGVDDMVAGLFVAIQRLDSDPKAGEATEAVVQALAGLDPDARDQYLEVLGRLADVLKLRSAAVHKP